MAECESSGRWHIDGLFDGGLQFHPSTWRAAGGSGYAYQASKLEQMYRAVLWHDKIGTWVTTAGWPRCGYA
jgi:Transglycosylase-like domain